MRASFYELDRKELASVLENPLRTRELHIDRAKTSWAALRLFPAPAKRVSPLA
ncbi:MAG: type II toxin-antitoxin system VapC family toxin [Burkholderiales bacterium]|nr:MAG: type II toxin-antitoxin system VapC family toxin [Burkholderiales bacterium]